VRNQVPLLHSGASNQPSSSLSSCFLLPSHLDLVRSPKLARNIDEVFRITDKIIRDATGFAHDLHTVLAVNWINQGPGQARANAWHKLGLLPTRLQAALWHAEDQRAKKDRICQSLKAFKQRSQEGLIQQERKENSSCPSYSMSLTALHPISYKY